MHTSSTIAAVALMAASPPRPLCADAAKIPTGPANGAAAAPTASTPPNSGARPGMPLTAEYQAIYEAGLKDQAEGDRATT
jgi:hypothetical protein